MTATREDIKGWLDQAQKKGARWLIVGRDNFDYENYPIYLNADEDIWYRIDHLGDNGTGGMGDRYDEVYDLSMDIPAQLAERRAYHLPPRPKPDERPVFGFTLTGFVSNHPDAEKARAAIEKALRSVDATDVSFMMFVPVVPDEASSR